MNVKHRHNAMEQNSAPGAGGSYVSMDTDAAILSYIIKALVFINGAILTANLCWLSNYIPQSLVAIGNTQDNRELEFSVAVDEQGIKIDKGGWRLNVGKGPPLKTS